MARVLGCLFFMLVCLYGKGQGKQFSHEDDLRSLALMENQEMTEDTNDGIDSLREEVAYLKEELEELKGSIGHYSQGCQTGMVDIPSTGIQCPKCRKTSHITFSPHFAKPPKVVYAFSKLDNINRYNLRIEAKMTDITAGSATLTVKTWKKTHIYMAAISWMACP